ncbi:MAG: DUF2125 domain-containing protein [Stellaceae bacterium]
MTEKGKCGGTDLAGAGSGGYKRPMRRKPRLFGEPAPLRDAAWRRLLRRIRRSRVLSLLLLLVLLCGGAYTAYWRIAAGRIRGEFTAWVESARTRKLDISWRKLRVAGFPAAFRLELTAASFRYTGLSPAPVVRLPALTGSARPWDLTDWRLAAPAGLTAEIAGAAGRAPIRVAARAASGAVAIAPSGGAAIWLTLENTTAERRTRTAIGLADAWIVLPPQPPRVHTEPLLGIGLHLQQVRLPVAVAPLGKTIDDLSAGLTVKGALPPGPLIRAISAWRDGGGTIAVDHLRLRWGTFGARGAGTLALDRDLQPIGAFSGAIEGYGEILTALVKSGHLRAREAGLARLALTMLAKAGPDGRPEIATSFTIENGEMYLGPARLGPVPRIGWE